MIERLSLSNALHDASVNDMIKSLLLRFLVLYITELLLVHDKVVYKVIHLKMVKSKLEARIMQLKAVPWT